MRFEYVLPLFLILMILNNGCVWQLACKIPENYPVVSWHWHSPIAQLRINSLISSRLLISTTSSSQGMGKWTSSMKVWEKLLFWVVVYSFQSVFTCLIQFNFKDYEIKVLICFLTNIIHTVLEYRQQEGEGGSSHFFY